MRRRTSVLVVLLFLCIALTSIVGYNNNKQENDLTVAQVVARRAAERASKLANTLWSDRASGVVSAFSTDAHVYAAASKCLFGSLAPTFADRGAVHRSFQLVSNFMKKTEADAMNEIWRLR